MKILCIIHIWHSDLIMREETQSYLFSPHTKNERSSCVHCIVGYRIPCSMYTAHFDIVSHPCILYIQKNMDAVYSIHTISCSSKRSMLLQAYSHMHAFHSDSVAMGLAGLKLLLMGWKEVKVRLQLKPYVCQYDTFGSNRSQTFSLRSIGL